MRRLERVLVVVLLTAAACSSERLPTQPTRFPEAYDLVMHLEFASASALLPFVFQ